MPFVAQREGYILAPYFDWISSLFHPSWRHRLQDIVGMIMKLADESVGSVLGRKVQELLTPASCSRLDEAVGVATEILSGFGADPHEVFLGTVHAGHPGGMLPLTEASARTMHDDRLPENVYVADATLFPKSLGNPPILTIIAMAKRILPRSAPANPHSRTSRRRKARALLTAIRSI